MKWKEPPTSGGQHDRDAYGDEAAELKALPKEWGVVTSFPAEAGRKTRDNNARHVAHNIKHGKYVAYRPPYSFEAVSRKEKNEEGVWVVNVYARYMGEPDGT